MLSVIVGNSNGSVHTPDINDNAIEQSVIVCPPTVHTDEEYDGGTE